MTRLVWGTRSLNSPWGSMTSPPHTKRSFRPSLLKSTMALLQPERDRVSEDTPARAVTSRKKRSPLLWKMGIVSLESAVWKMSGLPSSSMSRASAPMPERGRPASG